MSLSSRHAIAEHGSPFVRDGCTVLFHGSSRVVVTLLLLAAKTKQFNVLVTESRPNNEG
jgi:translation initiation factor eIF-2B subunit alpha